MTTPDTAAIRARLQATTWQPIETARRKWGPDIIGWAKGWKRPGPITWQGDSGWKNLLLAFEPATHWRPWPETPEQESDLAALLEAYDARGEEIKRLRAEKIDALAGKQAELIADQDIEIARLRAQIAALIAAAEGARAGAWRSIDDEARSGDLVLLRRHNGCADYEYALVWWRPDRDPEYPWHGEYNSYPDLRFDEYQPLPAPPRAGGEP